jgi:uncharacterized NAD(P)/FAD-binding protein YdhS
MSPRRILRGPVTKGTFWEMTAVPDIRPQTESLATYLTSQVKVMPQKQPE